MTAADALTVLALSGVLILAFVAGRLVEQREQKGPDDPLRRDRRPRHDGALVPGGRADGAIEPSNPRDAKTWDEIQADTLTFCSDARKVER
jgi:hypothetical protein